MSRGFQHKKNVSAIADGHRESLAHCAWLNSTKLPEHLVDAALRSRSKGLHIQAEKAERGARVEWPNG
jgi:hypothetical protein